MSSSANNLYATPTRERLPVPPASSTPPAAAVRTTPTSSPLPASSSSVTQNQPVTLESLLQTHASASSPPLAALEQAVSERNLLSSQNSQLWKLIEKSRSGYNHLLKDLERVRGERDAYKTKAHALTANVDPSVWNEGEKTLKYAVSNSVLHSSSSTSSNSLYDSRLGPTRAHSEDQTTPRKSTMLPSDSASSSMSDISIAYSRPRQQSADLAAIPRSAHPPSRAHHLHSSRSQDLSSGRQQPLQQISSQSAPLSPQKATHTHIIPPPRTLSAGVLEASTARAAPPRALPSTSSVSPPTIQSRPNNTDSSSSLSHTRLPSNVTPSVTIPPMKPPQLSALPAEVTSHPMQSQPSTSTTLNDAGAQQSTQGNVLQATPSLTPSSTMSALGPPNRQLSRESRISLPPEAKRYIANMGETPIPSPNLESFPSPSLQTKTPSAGPPQSGNSLSISVQAIPEGRGSVEGEFLNMDDDDDDDDGDEESDDVGQSPVLGSGQQPAGVHDFPLPPPSFPHAQAQVQAQREAHAQMQVQTHSPSQTPTYSQAQSHAHMQARALAQQQAFPQPPQAGPSYGNQSVSSLPSQVSGQKSPPAWSQGPEQTTRSHQGQTGPSSSMSSLDTPNPGHTSEPHIQAQTPVQARSHVPTHQHVTGAQGPASVSAYGTQDVSSLSSFDSNKAAFRALPLLATDLPYTHIQVANSSIRPNDRGKEVLSFIVLVDPGRGKEPWKVEKLYSDVLGLDQRIRASVGKGVGKKIANLPEGRLWRDHAPAKVDQRKALLENYLQTLINLPIKNKDEVIAFFTSDIMREAQKPVAQAGYKEGYLTKRGKNFGGWKSRYFVLQGPVLEYYESRGGTHLGSITITGAQIGRQQRSGDRREMDDEKEYRHAFLIIEAKRGPSNSHRHVLCAESDQDRDSWVEELVRYVMGSYNDEPPASSLGPAPISTNSTLLQGRSSTSSNSTYESSPTSRRPVRGISKDDLPKGPGMEIIAKGPAVPLSQLSQDASNVKLFQTPNTALGDTRESSPSKSDPSPIERQPSNGQKIVERSQHAPVSEGGLSSSLPTSSPLDGPVAESVGSGSQRSNSEMGNYSDLPAYVVKRHLSPERHRNREKPADSRKSYHPTLGTVALPSGQERAPTPEQTPSRGASNGKVKISGPMGGTPIPEGYKFGGKDAPPEASGLTKEERKEKVKSRSFWGFGKGNEKSHAPATSYTPRAVFGVTLEESLDVAEIANLPAIVFRCIQYLEAKKADQEEGIYRLSGSSAVIKNLKDRFNNEGDIDLVESDEYWDPHAIAGLLKSFLRELPASILTRELHLRFLAVIDFVDSQERIKELSQLIAALPIANYSLLRALTAHLILIVQNSGINKMTMRNVGIVFSPTLGIPAGVFSLMLGEFNRVFNVDISDEDADVKSENGLEPAEDKINRRNSRQYTHAAADQLLGLSGRTLAPPREDSTSDGDSILDDESGTETTDNEANIESPGSSPPESRGIELHVTPTSDTPTQSRPLLKPSKASQVAATRGLNLELSQRGNRHSRIVGLPNSPRPGHSPGPQQHLHHEPPVSPMGQTQTPTQTTMER